jgi:hypothetical protein
LGCSARHTPKPSFRATDLGNNVDSNVTNLTVNLTVPTGTTLLDVCVDGVGSDVITGATYNGTAMVLGACPSTTTFSML